MLEKAKEWGVSLNIKINLPRNLSLENYVKNPGRPIAPPVNLNEPNRNIPFGVRGRHRHKHVNRRLQQTLLYIGVRANPDGHEPLTEIAIDTTTPSTSARTYGRIALGPRRLTFEESPPLNVEATPTLDQTEDFDFGSIDEHFGRLSLFDIE